MEDAELRSEYLIALTSVPTRLSNAEERRSVTGGKTDIDWLEQTSGTDGEGAVT